MVRQCARQERVCCLQWLMVAEPSLNSTCARGSVVWRAQVPGMRKWLKFERSGRTEILQVDKHAIALQTGVQVTNAMPPVRTVTFLQCSCLDHTRGYVNASGNRARSSDSLIPSASHSTVVMPCDHKLGEGTQPGLTFQPRCTGMLSACGACS